MTAQDGTWRIGPLPASSCRLSAEHVGFAEANRRIDVPFGKQPLRIRLTARPLALDALVVTGGRRLQRLSDAIVAAMGRHSLDAGIEARREAIHSDRVIGAERVTKHVETFVQSSIAWRSFSIVPGVRVTRSNPWGTHWTPRIAFMYRRVPEIAVRLSAGEGFRAPAFKELYMEFLNVGSGFGYTVRGNPDLQPEVSRNVTASLEWAGPRTFLRVQAFENRFDDFIERALSAIRAGSSYTPMAMSMTGTRAEWSSKPELSGEHGESKAGTACFAQSSKQRVNLCSAGRNDPRAGR